MNPTETTAVAAIPEGTKAITKFTAEHGMEVGLPSPEAINYMMSVANMLTRSSLITPDMGEHPEQIKANAMAKMLVGHEMGIGAVQALRDIDIVKGRIFVRYPQLISQMLRKGFKLEWKERTAERAALLVEPPAGYPMMPELFEFTIEDAKAAGLTQPTRNGEPSQYTKRPRVMLSARVVSEAFRFTGGGAAYTPEERQEIMQDRGDPGAGDSTVFHEHAKNAEVNPFHVGTKPTKPEICPKCNYPITGPSHDCSKPICPRCNAPVGDDHKCITAETKQPTPEPPAPVAETKPAEPETVAPKAESPAVPPPTREEAPAPTNVVEMPKPEPAKPATTVAKKTDSERLRDLTDLLPAVSPETLMRKTFPEFLRGFLTLGKLPKADPRYENAIAVLGSILKLYRAQFLQDPHGCGVVAGAGWNKLVRWLSDHGWPEDCAQLAKAVAIARYPDSPDNLVEYLEDPIKVNLFNVPDLRTFMIVLGKTSPAVATRLKDAAEKSGRSMTEIVLGWQIDLEKAAEVDIVALLDKAATTPEVASATPPATPAVQPEPATAEEEEGMDSWLFGEDEKEGA